MCVSLLHEGVGVYKGLEMVEVNQFYGWMTLELKTSRYYARSALCSSIFGLRFLSAIRVRSFHLWSSSLFPTQSLRTAFGKVRMNCSGGKSREIGMEGSF